MSVDLRKRRNIGLLVALIIGTIVAIIAGTAWLRGQGQTLVVEVAYTSLVLIVALYLYDRLLIM